MTLRDSLEKQGAWLFRWRSYVPLLLLIPTIGAMWRGQLANSHESFRNAWEFLCLSTSCLGLFIRVVTVGFVPQGTSGRNTQYQLATVLNTSGLYSVVRNPLYLGNYLMFLGVALFPCAWWLPAIVSLVFWLYYERIVLAEEAFLVEKFGRHFEEWSAKTPAFIPKLSLWRNPTLSFSVRTVLRREYSGLMAMAAVFFFLEVLKHIFIGQSLPPEPLWLVIILGTTALYLILRILKRNTNILKLQDR